MIHWHCVPSVNTVNDLRTSWKTWNQFPADTTRGWTNIVCFQVWRPSIRLYIWTPRRAYNPAAISARWTLSLYRTHCHLCPTRHSFSPESGEQCPMIERGETWDFSGIQHPAGFETARQAPTSAKCHALTIAPCPSLEIKRRLIFSAHLRRMAILAWTILPVVRRR